MKPEHGGNLRQLAALSGRPAREIPDFSANINPLGPPEWLRSVVSRELETVVHYPDPDASSLAEALARRHAVARDEVIVGNGSSELLCALPRALGVSRAVIAVPSYIDYAKAARVAGLEVETFALAESAGFNLDLVALGSVLRGQELVFLGQPNNPTGLLFDPGAFRHLAESNPSTIFVVDEAFADFVEGYETLAHERPHNVVVVRSMTKFYAIPGIRLGYAVAAPDIINKAREMLPPWSVNALAQAIGEAALDDDDYARRTRTFVADRRERLIRALRQLPGLAVYPGRANFLLVRIERKDFDGPRLADALLQREGIAIRVCTNYDGLDQRFFRVAVRTEEENNR
ncbi:threonine-phosphate decarboxylase, partial [Candidatus Sumerlaeota bacterium]|nr:threonine-phosphate decarboxylase [Candidatus Sumerlaeota bacterium]